MRGSGLIASDMLLKTKPAEERLFLYLVVNLCSLTRFRDKGGGNLPTGEENYVLEHLLQAHLYIYVFNSTLIMLFCVVLPAASESCN